jgi:5'/3'-nucleotidase SurE
MAPAPLNILLTNDDGFNAPGIQTLYTALVAAGFNVHIVAPAVNQSAQGSSLGGTSALLNPIDITEFSPGNFFVDGKPATAALTGLDDLFAGHAPDLLISGTNRGENIGESENISGTVNGALEGLFEGIPSIAVSAGSFNGSFDAAFANAGKFMVDFLHKLQAAQVPGQPLLPTGEGLTINVPGNPTLAGVAVTTITAESSSAFPYAPNGTPNTWAEGFIPNNSPSGSPTSEGSQFLTNHITLSPMDGNWGATAVARDDLAVRLGSTMAPTPIAPHALNILLLNEDGYGSPGIVATRDKLLAAGYNVTVLAPATDQSGTGSALFLNPITVTQFDAHNYSANNGTPSSLVSLALDPQGLFSGVKPDLIVLGADQGDAVGIENANHSATLGGAITALFNYKVPAIALTSSSGSAASLATSAQFLTTLIENLQLTQGDSASLLPAGIGLSINVPVGATAGNYAFTSIDAATDANLSVLGNSNFAHYSYGAPVATADPHSEGNAFNAGKITISPLDGSIAAHDIGAYDALAALIGTTYGRPTTSVPGVAAAPAGAPTDDTIDGNGGHPIVAFSQAADQYTVTTSGDVITVEDRSGHDGTDTLTNVQHLEFQGSSLDASLLTDAAKLPQQQFGDLIELYVGYFNRAPDALGLAYWASRAVDGMSLAEISKSFFIQPETAADYPAGTTEAFVTNVYHNVLGRAPDQAGLAYWVKDLDSANVARDLFVLAIINGAKAATVSAADAQYLANKEAVGAHFALDKGLTDSAWATQVMAHVDGTAASVAAANQMTDAFAHDAVTTDPHLLLPLMGIHTAAV